MSFPSSNLTRALHPAPKGIAAVTADQTGHLLWLLRNGGTPSAAKAPKAAVILIGTNDIGFPASHGAADPSDFASGAVVRCERIQMDTQDSCRHSSLTNADSDSSCDSMNLSLLALRATPAPGMAAPHVTDEDNVAMVMCLLA